MREEHYLPVVNNRGQYTFALHLHMKVQPPTTLTVTSQGQVTFSKDILQHLGIRPGEKIELDKLPGGRISLRAARPAGTIDKFIGLLAGKTKKIATLDEINEAAASGDDYHGR